MAIGRASELLKPLPQSRIDALLAMPPHHLVRVYSYQAPQSMAGLEEHGYLTGSAPYVEGPDHDWARPYGWMRDQMANRIPDFSGDYPVWAWLKRPSTKPKPKLYRGTKEEYRVTALVPLSRMVLSDFDNWHCVLNNNLNAKTEAEWNAFHRIGFPIHESIGDDAYKAAYQQAIEPSWQNIFQFISTTDPAELQWQGQRRSFRVQACIDRIHAAEIVDIRRFENAH